MLFRSLTRSRCAVTTQLPAGWAAQRWGPKVIFTLNLLGHTLCLALPAAAAAASPLWLYGCLTAIGEQDHLPRFLAALRFHNRRPVSQAWRKAR